MTVTLNHWEWDCGFTGETKHQYTLNGEHCEEALREYTTFLGCEQWVLPEGYEVGRHWNGEPIVYPKDNMQEWTVIDTTDGMPCIWDGLEPHYLKKRNE